MDSVERLLDVEAEKHISQDEIVEANAAIISARVRVLLDSPEERDPYLWELMGVTDLNATAADYQAVQVIDRDMPWITEMGAMIAAANQQAVVETCLTDILNHSQDYGDTVEIIANGMSSEELSTAAKQGVGNVRRDAAKQRRTGNVDKNTV